MAAEFNPRDFRRGLRGAGLTDAEYRVAVELAEFSMIGKPEVWPSLPTLAENCCMADRRSVRRILGPARTPRNRSRDTSRSCAHRDTYCTGGARRTSHPAASDDRAGSSAVAASSMSHRCSGQERRLRA
jgi:hypothetical protein